MPGARAINPGGRVGGWAGGRVGGGVPWAGAALAKSLSRRRSSAWKKGTATSAPRLRACSRVLREACWGYVELSADATLEFLPPNPRARLRRRSVAVTGGLRHSQCRMARRPMEDLGQSLCLAQLGLRRKRPHKLDVTPHRVACCHACERIGVIVLLTVQEGAHRAPG